MEMREREGVQKSRGIAVQTSKLLKHGIHPRSLKEGGYQVSADDILCESNDVCSLALFLKAIFKMTAI